MSVLGWLWGDTPGPRIEPLEADCAGRLAEIHATAFARPWSALDFERLLAERGVIADGVFADGGDEVDGFVLSRRVLDEAEILTVAMAPSGRGRGFGAILLRPHLEALSRLGVRRVHLEVEDGNAPALALYRRLGFAETGRRTAYYAKQGGPHAAAILMSLDL
jgi:ribosomal-protein-alanine N-acetyltransferase